MMILGRALDPVWVIETLDRSKPKPEPKTAQKVRSEWIDQLKACRNKSKVIFWQKLDKGLVCVFYCYFFFFPCLPLKVIHPSPTGGLLGMIMLSLAYLVRGGGG